MICRFNKFDYGKMLLLEDNVVLTDWLGEIEGVTKLLGWKVTKEFNCDVWGGNWPTICSLTVVSYFIGWGEVN